MTNEKMVRRIDELGRVVIPKKVREVLGVREGDPLEISVNTMTGQIIIEKFKPDPSSEIERK